MNSITLTDNITFDTVVNALALEELTYQIDSSNLSVQSPDIDAVIDVLVENGIEDYFVTRDNDEPWDGFRTDAEADADALASAGMGTDEDYGYYGNSSDE
jgi:hypothetical protein